MVVITNFREEQYPATDEMQTILVYIPAGDEFKYLLAGLMRLPGVDENYQGADEEQVAGLAEIWREAYETTDWSEGVPIPDAWRSNEVNCWVHEAAVIAGNPLAVSALTTQFHNVIGLQNTPTINSKLRWLRYMAAGSWSFSYLYRRLTNGGVIDIYVTPPVGSTVVALNDHDTRGTTLDNQFARGSFTVVTGGLQTIEIEVVSSSSGSNYGNTFTLLQMWRTGD